MSQGTLKWLRLATPGLIIIFFFTIFGKTTGLWWVPLPSNLKDALASANVLIPAGIYYLLPFRTWANKRYFDSVSENLRSRMVQASDLQDEPDIYTWNSLRGVFYHLIDNDQSLSKKASLAYFNGYIWTTCADIRVIAYVYAILAALFYWAWPEESIQAAVLFLAIVFASYFGSKVATRRQRMIGNEQIEIIQLFHQDKLRSSLDKIRERTNNAGN